MAIEHSFETAPGYLVVRIAGYYSLSELSGVIVAIGLEAGRGAHTRVLIDTTALRGDAPDMDRYETGVFAAEQFARLERVAVLAAPHARINGFLEDVARNRGLQVCVTKDPGEALAWLTNP